MNRINQLFQDSPKNLLSIYFCAGCPTLEGTADVIRALEKNGVNMIEIGIPFSDPMADGIVIQNAATRALRNGMSLRLLFEQLHDIRRDVRIPLILMGYLNPIMQFGFEAFCRKCVECGIDGVIIPDLPFRDYEESYKAIALKYDIRVIMLITPETSEARIREIDAHTDGFIYLVSSAATTKNHIILHIGILDVQLFINGQQKPFPKHLPDFPHHDLTSASHDVADDNFVWVVHVDQHLQTVSHIRPHLFHHRNGIAVSLIHGREDVADTDFWEAAQAAFRVVGNLVSHLLFHRHRRAVLEKAPAIAAFAGDSVVIDTDMPDFTSDSEAPIKHLPVDDRAGADSFAGYEVHNCLAWRAVLIRPPTRKRPRMDVMFDKHWDINTRECGADIHFVAALLFADAAEATFVFEKWTRDSHADGHDLGIATAELRDVSQNNLYSFVDIVHVLQQFHAFLEFFCRNVVNAHQDRSS